jgi:uncharacterized membrane protein YbaN (DUF454 family)
MATIGGTGLISIFFFSGPFAWNGIVGFWLPVGSYVPFLIVTFVVFYRTIIAEKDFYQPPISTATVGAPG